MWAGIYNRKDMLDVFLGTNGNRCAARAHIVDALPITRGHDHTIVVWADNPVEQPQIPSLVIVDNGGVREFLAWATTYIPELFPFTSFCRIADRSLIDLYLAKQHGSPCAVDDGVVAGLIIGEVLTQSAGRAVPEQLSPQVLTGTLSFGISRLLTVTGTHRAIGQLQSAWISARELSGMGRVDVPILDIVTVWKAILGIPDESRQPRLWDTGGLLRQAWAELARDGVISDHLYSGLSATFPDVGEMHELLRKPREQRVSAIDIALRLLSQTPMEARGVAAFLAGYVTSLVGPGSLEHAGLLAQYAKAYPTALMWYGACSNVVGKNVGIVSGNRLARQLIRHVKMPDRLTDRPRCDIAIDEYSMLQGDGRGISGIVGANGRIDIDLLPCVTCSIRSQQHGQGEDEERQLRAERDSEHMTREAMDMLNRSIELMGRAHSVMREAAEMRRRGEKRKKK
jgi:hypothetical protein